MSNHNRGRLGSWNLRQSQSNSILKLKTSNLLSCELETFLESLFTKHRYLFSTRFRDVENVKSWDSFWLKKMTRYIPTALSKGVTRTRILTCVIKNFRNSTVFTRTFNQPELTAGGFVVGTLKKKIITILQFPSLSQFHDKFRPYLYSSLVVNFNNFLKHFFGIFTKFKFRLTK